MASHVAVPRSIRNRLCLALGISMMATAAAHAATPAEIDKAIASAQKFLYTQQQPSGHWELDNTRKGTEHNHQEMQGDAFGGFSAAATYALLASGESAQDPRLQKAIRFLEDADVIGIYSLGLRANVWPLLPATDKRARAMSEHDCRAIINGMETGKQSPINKGFWDYGNGRGVSLKGTGRLDHSVSQYGVLGLWAWRQNGAEVDRKIWELIDAGWKAHQLPDGGWDYDKAPPAGGQATASMTAAGVATLFISEDMLYTDRGITCKGNIVSENIEKGLKWMTEHFNDVNNSYAFYGVERIGTASGRKYFGPTDWYAAGANMLIKNQRADGSWEGGFPGATAVPATAFALLFLVRGREPVMFNKLQYDITSKLTGLTKEGNWNQRPRDVANLTRWTANRIEHGLNWQIVNLKASIEDLHDAPILYLSGDQELSLSTADEAKLREFVQSGGMILGNGDCGTSKTLFAKSFEALGHKLFPKYEFRDLPAEHPIFTNQPFPASKWKTPQKVRSLSNGIREMMILVPDADPARAWQLRADQTSDFSFQLGADIFLYAVDKKNLLNKGEVYILKPDPKVIADKTIKVGRLMLGDNWDPEPLAWQRFATFLHNKSRFDVDVQNVKLADPKLASYKILHLTGTTHIALQPAERTKLSDYVKHGGTLIVDAAGGSAEFADSAVIELRACFEKAADEGLKAPLDPQSPVFNLPVRSNCLGVLS